MTRAFARSGAKTVGNFWVDLTRATLYVLLPLSILVALAFVAMGLPQTLDASVTATTLEGAQQTIALGPIASQEAIKQLGTNGGGFFNVNAAHPFENADGAVELPQHRRDARRSPRRWSTPSARWSATAGRAGRSSPRPRSS